MAVTIADLEYGNRTPSEFISQAIIDSGIVSQFSLYDGVKDKQQIPIFAGSLTWGTDVCEFNPLSVASIDEKEFTATNYKWAFKNCKTALQQSYRGMMLKKGMNNAETMDSQFKDWVFEYFAKLSGQYINTLAWTNIMTEIGTDASVNKGTSVDLVASVDPAQVLGILQKIWMEVTEEMYIAHYNPQGTTIDQAPGLSFILPFEIYQAAHVAITQEMSWSDREDLEAGRKILSYMGVPVYLEPNLAADKVLIAPLDNFVTVVDDIADIRAIQTKYIEELSSDYLWGQMCIGHGYKKSELIVEYTLTSV